MAITTAARDQLAAVLVAAGGQLARKLAENDGRMPLSAVSEALGRHRSDKTLREAMGIAVKAGYYTYEGPENARVVRRTQPFRVARICPKCHGREFGSLGWICGIHGIAEDQPNVPYAVSRLEGPPRSGRAAC